MPNSSDVKKALKIHGRVQGVGFRWWTRGQAQALDLRGTVRNCRDGTVEVVLAGPAPSVAAMQDRLENGPGPADVVRVEELAPPEEDPPDFRIIH